jgi:YegS/Rv2252/BmrU family lipid kinase
VVKAAIAKSPMVIIGGGDGTLSSTVDHFMGSNTVFAVLPLGTANSFARTLGLPLDLEGAIDVIASGRRKRIDLGIIDGDYFANAAALGLSPMIADTVPHVLKKYLGMLGYLIWAVRVAFKFRPFRLRVTLDDGSVVQNWATEARIANGTHHGGVELVEHQALDSGEIVIQAVTGKSLWGLAWSWFTTLFKLRRREQTTTEWRGRKMRLEARPAQKISIDGEIAAKTPVTIEVAKGAIEVAAPKTSRPD